MGQINCLQFYLHKVNQTGTPIISAMLSVFISKGVAISSGINSEVTRLCFGCDIIVLLC